MGRSRSRRRRGKSGGVGSSRSKSKSNKSKSKSTGGSRGRSSNTRGGQSKANRNQNKKARRTVKSVSKAIGKATRGAAANAASAVANSSLASKYNRKTRDMSKLTPQARRRYERLSAKTGRDYSQRIPTMRINLSADRLAQFAGVSDKGWYKGLTNRFPGIRKLQINKQLYSNPMKKGWHSSQRTGRGQGIPRIPRQDLPSATADMGPQQDWLGDLYSSHNISGGKLDQGARDYWSNEAKTKGRDAVMQSIIGTSKAQGTYGGRKEPQRIDTGSRRRGGGGLWGMGVRLAGMSILKNKKDRSMARSVHKKRSRKMQKSLAASLAAFRGGM